uniref:Uncharacterized protein n=1 Tax=Oryza rufipogon TaxID=4529 RepID=A0A0E0PE20_ORYRU
MTVNVASDSHSRKNNTRLMRGTYQRTTTNSRIPRPGSPSLLALVVVVVVTLALVVVVAVVVTLALVVVLVSVVARAPSPTAHGRSPHSPTPGSRSRQAPTRRQFRSYCRARTLLDQDHHHQQQSPAHRLGLLPEHRRLREARLLFHRESVLREARFFLHRAARLFPG